MEYIYAVMLLNKAGKEINEENVSAVLQSAGVEVDQAKVKSLVAALDGVDVDKIIEESSVAAPAAAPAASGGAQAESEAGAAESAGEEKQEEKEDNVDAAAGLGSLF